MIAARGSQTPFGASPVGAFVAILDICMHGLGASGHIRIASQGVTLRIRTFHRGRPCASVYFGRGRT
jgi:hypothetical protein